jgi:hypothetical protein
LVLELTAIVLGVVLTTFEPIVAVDRVAIEEMAKVPLYPDCENPVFIIGCPATKPGLYPNKYVRDVEVEDT